MRAKRADGTLDQGQIERLMLGFACGLAFDCMWFDSWLSGIVIANWVLMTHQVGHARFQLRDQGQSWRSFDK